MLEFFRRYQRYFFLVITVVIVISFSFFGTYNTLGSNQWREQIAFTAIDGTDVTRQELDEMAIFLSSDNQDKILFGGQWGPNFLNDGVITKDFLQTGMGVQLIDAYVDDLQEDLQTRHEKEKRYSLYVHPQAKFLSAVNVWNYFAPEMPAYYETLRQSADPKDPTAVNARVQLFLSEKKVPQTTLKQVLRYQQQQYNWISRDPNLDRGDLSLFGYHTLEDWFGPRFVRLVAQFIINTAKIAEQKGYRVSKAEALAELTRNADISYQQNKNRPNIGVTNPRDYLSEQLRILGMDQVRAAKIWQQVMLFRRYFHDVGNAALVDAFTYKKFNDYTKEALEVQLYHLPKALRFGNANDLQRFEIYLAAVSPRPKEGAAQLKLPTTFSSIAEVSKQHPELVQRKYRLEVASIDKRNLQARVSLKETWAWELEEAHWKTLQNQFPELGVKSAKTRDERLASLDSLDAMTRARVDAFSRSAIVDARQDWLKQALEEAPSKSITVGLRTQGGKTPFAGLEENPEKQKALVALLDKADKDPKTQEQLASYSADGQSYYRIKVIERAPKKEILTFEEAANDGTLDQIRDRLLKKYYADNKESTPLPYQNSDGSWKPFEQVKDLVSAEYFADVLKAIQKDSEGVSKGKAKLSNDEIATLRLHVFVKDIQSQLKKDSSSADRLTKSSGSKDVKDVLAAAKPLQEQWLLEKETVRLERSDDNPLIDDKEAFAMPDLAWSSVKAVPNGDIAFFQVVRHLASEDKEIAVADQTKQAHALLSDDAQQILMATTLKELQEKKALSLDYLKTPLNPSP